MPADFSYMLRHLHHLLSCVPGRAERLLIQELSVWDQSVPEDYQAGGNEEGQGCTRDSGSILG